MGAVARADFSDKQLNSSAKFRRNVNNGSWIGNGGFMKRVFLLVAAVVLCVIVVFLRTPTVRLSENFDKLAPQLSVSTAGAFHTLNGTNVDIVGGNLFGSLCAPPESGNCIDMGGTGGNPQGVLQSTNPIALAPGVKYYLSFDLIGSQRGNTTSTTVSFGPYKQTFILASGGNKNGIVQKALVTVSAPQFAYLTFANNTYTEEGALLDNIRVTSVREGGTVLMYLLLAVAVCCVVLFFIRPRKRV